MRKPFRIFDRIYLVGGPDTTDSRDCCIYLADGGSELALIDSGLGSSCRFILENIKELGLDVSLLKYVIATHGHIDHIGGLQYFKNLGAKVVCHELEAKAVAVGKPELTAERFYRVKYKPVDIDITLSGSAPDIKIGDITLHCPLTPGHTAGGINPYTDIKGTRVLFGQDIHGPFDQAWGSDMKKWRNSMKLLLDLKADILCEGHFGVYEPKGKVREYIESCLSRFS